MFYKYEITKIDSTSDNDGKRKINTVCPVERAVEQKEKT